MEMQYNRELQSAKKERDIHVFVRLCDDIDRVIINHLPIHEIASHL